MSKNEYSETLTGEEMTEVYLMLTNMLIPYIKTKDVTNYQVAKLVDAIRKIGNVYKGGGK